MKKINIRWQLAAYDILIMAFVDILLLALYRSNENLSFAGVLSQSALSLVCVMVARLVGKIYQQIWRYGGIQCYIRLLVVDGCAFVVNLILEIWLPIEHITFARLLAVSCMNLLGALAIRLMYRYAYKCGSAGTAHGRFLNFLLRFFAPGVKPERRDETQKIKVAIVGAGRVGATFAEELLNNRHSPYTPRCFVDVSKEKIGRSIHGMPVFLEDETVFRRMEDHEVQEVVFAVPDLAEEEKKRLYSYYLQAGYKIKVYDYPLTRAEGDKRHLREFDIEELLFRKPVALQGEQPKDYYEGKSVLITGGGGSIGSELCRQLVGMNPRQIVILDIYENGAYDVQQELKIAYGDALDLKIEIASVTDRKAMTRVFETYHPEIVIHAAAHKHVPLMEHNCIQAVENNVFGTETLVQLCEIYGVEHFIMVSTDKAVNPTNVMGATKRMCEMIVQSAGIGSSTVYSATRFGNVLGSAGSVIPLFRKQIASGGPVTITDKRIIRYFMTIPEAAQLVLQSGALVKNGELAVLDMGQPVKILDLAESMIRLSGATGIEIVETGLRPGEKLYEELLVKVDELEKTENDQIFIEREVPLAKEEVERKLALLKRACATGDDDFVRETLMQVVPTYRPPEEVNSEAEAVVEMHFERELVMA